jgi:hypothetical protein
MRCITPLFAPRLGENVLILATILNLNILLDLAQRNLFKNYNAMISINGNYDLESYTKVNDFAFTISSKT